MARRPNVSFIRSDQHNANFLGASGDFGVKMPLTGDPGRATLSCGRLDGG